MRLHGHGKTYSTSLYDLTHPKPEDNRTAEEIVADVVKRAGLEVKG